MSDITTSSSFFRALLVQCIGTVMIELEQWKFPKTDGFNRGYFNERLKRPDPINTLTRNRLKYLFKNVFSPGNRGGRFQEPQAVEAANAFIELVKNYFHVDLSIWTNNYTTDNSISRSHLLSCLDIILALIEGTELLPSKEITDSLNNYMEEVSSTENMPATIYPKLLTTAPYQQTTHFWDRKDATSSLIKKLISGQSCYFYGIGGIGKTEIAKSILKQLLCLCQVRNKKNFVLQTIYLQLMFYHNSS